MKEQHVRKEAEKLIDLIENEGMLYDAPAVKTFLHSNHYAFPVPSTQTYNWDELSWLKWIAYTGVDRASFK